MLMNEFHILLGFIKIKSLNIQIIAFIWHIKYKISKKQESLRSTIGPMFTQNISIEIKTKAAKEN